MDTISIPPPEPKPRQLTAADLVIDAFANENAYLRAENRQLREDMRAMAEIAADLLVEKNAQHDAFIDILRLADEARLRAVRERDSLLERQELARA